MRQLRLISLVLFVLLAIGASATLPDSAGAATAAGTAAEPHSTSSAGTPAQDVPEGWLSQVQQDIAAQEYHLSWQSQTAMEGIPAAWHAPNRAHNFRSYFTSQGLHVVPRVEPEPSWELKLSLAGYGRGEKVWPLPAAQVSPTDNRIDYHHGGVEEWYVNGPSGLKQGFFLPAPPEVVADWNGARPLVAGGPLPGRGHTSAPEELVYLELALTGNLSPALSADGQAIEFIAPTGARVARYAELAVTDAAGQPVPAWMEGYAGSGQRGIRLVLDASDAVYPLTIDPLLTSPAWTAQSDQAGAYFGYAVSTAGDVNGDGYADVIVGAHYYDNGALNEGRAYVYHGSASGLVATPAWTAEGGQADGRFGSSVATAGDVDGDGYADVIVGAHYYDNGETDEGRAYVYHGSAAGLVATAAWTAESDQAGAYFGYSVATAGDVNDDGYADVIVGAYSYDNGHPNEGWAFVYHGSATGLAGSPNAGPGDAAWTAESNQPDASFGNSVATAGDVNGDGYADVIVGAYLFYNGEANEGRVFVYHGSATGLTTPATPDWIYESGQTDAYFGGSVATAGDVNGDGYADVIIGAAYYDNGAPNEGKAWVYHGSATGLSTPAWTAESDQAVAYFGYAVSTAGDVNGDGYADVIVGAHYYDNGALNEGRAYVYHGSATGLTTSAWIDESGQTDAYFGVSVATAGDVNGDGYADVIVGAYRYDNVETDEGQAFVYHGSAAGLAATPAWTAESDQAGALLGYSVATAGDVNGDGYVDIIVGAYAYDNGQTDEGTAYVYHGSATGLTTPVWTAESDQAGASFGWSVATAGDVNGDGYADVIVGAYRYDNVETDEGRAFVYHGSAIGLAAGAAWTAESDQADARFGNSVATAGDVNGDGYSDVILGASCYNNGETYEGRAFVYHGSGAGLAATPAWTAESDRAAAYFGRSVATAGDVNGDGYADVIVGAHYYDGSETDEGRAFVYHGSGAGLAATPAWTAESDQAAAYFGNSVSTAGDVNGDGYADVIVGAYLYENGETDEGRAFVYYGNDGPGLSLAPRQMRSDFSSPVALQGRSDDLSAFGLNTLARTPFGSGRVKLEWEVKPRGNLFDGSGTGQSAAWMNLTAADIALDAAFSETASGLTPSTDYHWRLRLLYHPAVTAFAQSSRWFTIPMNGWNETDLSTKLGEADLAVSMIDLVDPMTRSQQPAYTLTVVNNGPNLEVNAAVTTVLDAGAVFVSATPDQGSCTESTGTVTCNLGALASGENATIDLVTAATTSGLYTTQATVSGHNDPNAANDNASEDTTVVDSILGGLVWEDRNGNGVQDAGEPRMGGIQVDLLDAGSGTPVNLTVSASDGRYAFGGLAGSYRLRFVVPAGWILTMPDMGGDDLLDSDPDVITGETPDIGPVFVVSDAVKWSAGLRQVGPCLAPDEPIWVYNVRMSTDGNDYPILDFMDFNQPDQVTGYNVYRSSDPGLAPSLWPLEASNVIDGDESTPNKQWVDISGDDPPGGIWYYDVAAYNSGCDAEGPR